MKLLPVLLIVLGVLIVAGFYMYSRARPATANPITQSPPAKTISEVSEDAMTTSSSTKPEIEQKPVARVATVATTPTSVSVQKTTTYKLAHEFVSPDGYLNTDGKAITLAQYRGHNVVVLEFWTYSCINCERTLPYVTSWYAKYKDQGLVVIGVHTPEFSYEHVTANVADALKKYGIEYPVVQDNEYQTWNAYANQFWPHTYVINIDGYITHDQIGEGGYAETEKAIEDALQERAQRMGK